MTTAKSWKSIDFASVPKHFDSREAEQRWDQVWQQSRIYHWDPAAPRDESFVVDTPPPTVSGSLHVGHVFSYTHTDLIVRYQRMRGKNIFYPMGWDDNGLPTERRVQNYYHVRCDVHQPYEEGLKLDRASAKQRKGRPRLVSRQNFIELCLELTIVDEEAFKELFSRVGLSVDWRQEYATIDEQSRRLAQYSFIDLHTKGLIYTSDAPTMWDPDFQTAVAQAEVEDRMQAGAYHHIQFGVQASDRSLVIATTRPEMLPACVGVAAHPEDKRYRDLFGKNAVTPLFYVPVPIFASELADPEKGTGVLMVCTFGDQTDVDWWREQQLELRQILGRNGRLRPVTFGEDTFSSLEPEKANGYYAELEGKNVRQAQLRIVELLREPDGSATGDGPPLQGEPEPIEHAVKFYEKGDRPLEYLPTRQWFARLLERKDELLAKGAEIEWHPGFMQTRYLDWTRNLALDWCLSRQRYFGVPIPAWYPLDGAGEPDYGNPLLPQSTELPIDPTIHTPAGFEESQRGKPGGFQAEEDIFDTWFTSSLSPQIGSHWFTDPQRHASLFPADVRPQSHEIIRTWAFYTIAKALMHEDKVPWDHVLISGWVLDPDRKKMSKTRGNAVTPLHLLDEYSADACRYWAASARLGVDTAFDPKMFKIGRRLVTKIYNAGKFVLSQQAEVHPVTAELDRAFVQQLREVVQRATLAFDEFSYAAALSEAESFFWSHFTDTYLELAKVRARSEGDPRERGSAVAGLRTGLNVLLRLLAPILPFITEEVWSWAFAEETGHASIHIAPWPATAELAGIDAPDSRESFDIAVAALTAINKRKSQDQVSGGREVAELTLRAHPDSLTVLEDVLADVTAATRCGRCRLEADDGMEPAEFEVARARYVDS